MATNMKASLTKKVGPLPMVAWVGMVAAAYVIYRYYKASRSSAATADSPVVTAQGDIGSASDFTSGFGGIGGTAQGSSIQTPTVSGPSTNVDWGNNAANGAIAMGYNPTDVEAAIGSYLYGTGTALNDSQSAILRWVLTKFGTPPESVILPPPTTPPPNVTPQPPSTPVTGVAPDDPMRLNPPHLAPVSHGNEDNGVNLNPFNQYQNIVTGGGIRPPIGEG